MAEHLAKDEPGACSAGGPSADSFAPARGINVDGALVSGRKAVLPADYLDLSEGCVRCGELAEETLTLMRPAIHVDYDSGAGSSLEWKPIFADGDARVAVCSRCARRWRQARVVGAAMLVAIGLCCAWIVYLLVTGKRLYAGEPFWELVFGLGVPLISFGLMCRRVTVDYLVLGVRVLTASERKRVVTLRFRSAAQAVESARRTMRRKREAAANASRE